ncbi:MAG: site-2 protease family protein [Deltaproteobacteria bacterium]
MKISFNLFIIPVAAVLFFSGQLELYAIAYFSAFFHEIAHVLTAKKFKLDVKEIEFLPIGFAARITGLWRLSPIREIILLLAGPAVNLLFCISLLLIVKIFPDENTSVIINFIFVNIFLVCFNMLPIIPLDGGRILMIILSQNIGIIKCASFCTYISKLLNSIFFILGILLFILSGNFIILLVSFYALGFILYDDRCSIAESFLYILNKKNLFKKNKIIDIKLSAVIESTCLIRLIREIDRKNLIITVVFNQDNEIIGRVSENKIIEHLLVKGENTAVGELL